MFKEWKAILKTNLIIVMMGIYSSSVQYHIFCLNVGWDPYGQLSDLPVAVVNNDKEASYTVVIACL